MVTLDRTGKWALAALLLGLAGVARAGPGNGIRFGGSAARLHPYVETELRYDSNIAYTDEGQKTSGFILHLRPGLTLESPTDPAAITLNANLDWAQYLGKNSDLSRLYAEAQLGVGINRRGALGLEVSDIFRRSNTTRVLNFGGAVIENSNVLEVGVPWRPGGGAFVTTVTGGWTMETFEPLVGGDQESVRKLGYNEIKGGLDLRWRFLPRTAAVLQGEYWKRFPNNSEFGSRVSGWRAWGGAAGLLTARLAGTIKGGWGAVNDAPGSVSTWLANGEIEWIPMETASLKAGYIHDLGADPGTFSAYTSHRGYLDGRAQLAGRYTFQLNGSYEHRDYPGTGGFTANLLVVEPSVDVELARWLRVGAGAAYTRRTSELPEGATRLPGFNFNKTEAYVRLRGTY